MDSWCRKRRLSYTLKSWLWWWEQNCTERQDFRQLVHSTGKTVTNGCVQKQERSATVEFWMAVMFRLMWIELSEVRDILVRWFHIDFFPTSYRIDLLISTDVTSFEWKKEKAWQFPCSSAPNIVIYSEAYLHSGQLCYCGTYFQFHVL